MNLVTSIIWLIGGIMWSISAVKHPEKGWQWIIALISFAACMYYAHKFDKELNK